MPAKVDRAKLTLIKPPSPADKPPKLKAVQTARGEGELEFTFNPNEFTISKSASWQRDDQSSAEHAPMPQYKGPQPATLSLEVFLDGTDPTYGKPDQIAKKADRLLSAVRPLKETLNDNTPSAPWVVFSWGKFMFIGVVTKVDAKYTLFDGEGAPIRATCTLSLEEVPTDPPPRQNPTSGGVTTRRMHRIIAGDSLPSIAYQTFGDPARWRDIADLNGIDDPMRIEPGVDLLIPDLDQPGELAAAG